MPLNKTIFSTNHMGNNRLLHSILLIITVLNFNCGKNPSTPQKVFRFSETILVDGLERTYLLNLPPTYYESGGFSLVIAMHGGGGDAEQFEKSSGLTDKGNRSGFIIVYPNGIKSTGLLKAQTWNGGSCCDYAVEKNIDDVKFISQLIDHLAGKYKINQKKVYATGHSNGGIMAYRLACELSTKIAAIAPNGCTMTVTSPCKASRPVPVLHMHSVNDRNVPYRGGYGEGVSKAYFPAVDSVLNVWSLIDACNTKAQKVEDNSGYTLFRWSDCLNQVNIRFYLTKDGGHAWPGGSKGSAMGDTPSQAIIANDLIWDFFQQYQLP
ncbi:MAG: phospholipase [Chitinophagaceae bacterium]|nr:MAG: phospholipase [Chitinophagaceae bacterium]